MKGRTNICHGDTEKITDENGEALIRPDNDVSFRCFLCVSAFLWQMLISLQVFSGPLWLRGKTAVWRLSLILPRPQPPGDLVQ